MTGRLVYQDNIRSVYELEDQPGVVDHIEYASPMAAHVDQALGTLKEIRDSSGTMTTAQLSTALRAISGALVALGRLHLGREETD